MGLILCALNFVTPSIALGLGLVIGLLFDYQVTKHHKTIGRVLLQASVVGIGFGIDFGRIVELSYTTIGFVISVVVGALLVGGFIGYLLHLNRNTTYLISTGTAICGGSAIAALAPVIDADEKEISVSLGVIFLINSAALFLFPIIGNVLDLTQLQFGVWSSVAIHDTSSVVGAASKYGEEALSIATTVKLSRTLWILPLVFGAALFMKKGAKGVQIPIFVLFFLAASVIRTNMTEITWLLDHIVDLAKIGLTITLFLIGSSFSRHMLKSIGIRSLIHALLLWILISISTLFLVLILL